MSDTHDRELEDETRALLRAVRVPPAVPPAVKARAMRRLALALPVTMGAPDPGAAPADPGASSAVHRLGRALAARVPAWSLAASFLAGGALALAVTRGAPGGRAPAPAPPAAEAPAARPPEIHETETATAPAQAPEVTTPVTPSALPAAAASIASPAPPAATPRGSAGERSRSTLEAERALLDVARTALGRGDGASALRATEEHARAFPRGLLAEEREAMSIQALRLLHRDDDAAARLDGFRARYPASLIRPALEATGDGGAP